MRTHVRILDSTSTVKSERHWKIYERFDRMRVYVCSVSKYKGLTCRFAYINGGSRTFPSGHFSEISPKIYLNDEYNTCSVELFF